MYMIIIVNNYFGMLLNKGLGLHQPFFFQINPLKFLRVFNPENSLYFSSFQFRSAGCVSRAAPVLEKS